MLVPRSGTTGAPKGVEVTHENVVSGIAALQTYTEQIGIEVRLPIVITCVLHLLCAGRHLFLGHDEGPASLALPVVRDRHLTG